MREKIIILSVLLLLPLHAYGLVTDCPDTTDPDTCWQTPGCQLYGDGLIQKYCAPCEERSYCPGGTAQQTNKEQCPQNFSLSPKGSTSQNDCYKKIDENNNYCEKENGEHIATCGLFYPNGTPKCWNTGEYDTGYHIESNNKCYSNIRNCNQFQHSGPCTSDNVSGALRWSSDGYWFISKPSHQCECTQQNTEHGSCTAKVTYTSYDVSNDDNTENASVTYTISSYECTKCPAGTYLAQSDFTSNSQCTGDNVACSCTDTDKGYYSTGCNINGVQSISSCQQTPCPKPGQTTNDPGAGTSEGACHYSSETKFCDAAGCFTISDAGNDNVWLWTY